MSDQAAVTVPAGETLCGTVVATETASPAQTILRKGLIGRRLAIFITHITLEPLVAGLMLAPAMIYFEAMRFDPTYTPSKILTHSYLMATFPAVLTGAWLAFRFTARRSYTYRQAATAATMGCLPFMLAFLWVEYFGTLPMLKINGVDLWVAVIAWAILILFCVCGSFASRWLLVQARIILKEAPEPIAAIPLP